MNDRMTTGETGSSTPTRNHDRTESERKGQRARRFPAATLLSGAALLSTTALLVTLDTKIPPFKGD